MDKEFWHQRWQAGQIGFHTPEAHWALLAYWPELVHQIDEPVLVPLCGKTLDMRWLCERGHPVTGIELNPIAVHDFFAEWKRRPTPIEQADQALSGLEADGVSLWQGDFFAFKPATAYRAFYDRAALIALPPAMRKSYVEQLRKCLAKGSIGLLVTLEYDQNLKGGPPFSVSFEEVAEMTGFDSVPLERRDVLDESSKFRAHGITSLHETVYRLTAV
ncbi:thiopurine S-methyltransferase [Wenzhouxiangella limi]|uniref:Thiopurine S-methyltransferase n=1 Tax=Wenzhouxiangella limi TaxID=2707351 RepID=A0A845UWZ0_9GAMM|nr:thiopurine S-methyltransferase [Wenzhouxiangella limi]NDY94752.1 thiopurine S-methyltransferase [Wenzhouxiangella limi]